MEQYIPKSTLVAEIERLRESLQDKVKTGDFIAGEVFIMNYFLSFLDTLEVKEVDLDIEKRIKECPFRQVACNRYEDTPVICDGRCSLVADYPKLKELKAQKGE